ncbi:hypothetical protein QBC46DRAFT_412662 [Diplogelasinospora grovesii]|uniref:Uncharacterized protein n=1 Tax=Diplogelasinospora grovesii TaxID=303347 RepID=A0AAN6RZP6_9PEZI|nr:hypothetical protein QBC46DRAFT_412662 [Diplogelasinospora grovesii]
MVVLLFAFALCCQFQILSVSSYPVFHTYQVNSASDGAPTTPRLPAFYHGDSWTSPEQLKYYAKKYPHKLKDTDTFYYPSKTFEGTSFKELNRHMSELKPKKFERPLIDLARITPLADTLDFNRPPQSPTVTKALLPKDNVGNTNNGNRHTRLNDTPM